MEGKYSIFFGEDIVGTAEVSREGLYYRFRCECRLVKKQMCKICVRCGQGSVLLGTPIPEGQSYVLSTKVPAKRFGGGDLQFAVLTESKELFGKFITIKENEPFLHLKNLKYAYLKELNGERGIVISDSRLDI